jgi:predicted O-methyltransferase YrrM
VIEPRLLDIARGAKGFMPDDEGLALHDAAVRAGPFGPLLEIGTYCGKSAVYLGAAARATGTILFTLDHHRGSEENQAGWEHHDTEVVDPATGEMDTLPFFRRTIEAAGLEDVVVAVVGHSLPIARAWRTPLSFLFIDGGHAEEVAMADYAHWSPHITPGGALAIHDVFENPAEGGQAPFHVWQRAVADGFAPRSTTGSLRILRR